MHYFVLNRVQSMSMALSAAVLCYKDRLTSYKIGGEGRGGGKEGNVTFDRFIVYL